MTQSRINFFFPFPPPPLEPIGACLGELVNSPRHANNYLGNTQNSLACQVNADSLLRLSEYAEFDQQGKLTNGGKWENIFYAMFGHVSGHLYGKLIYIIGLKAPGNYSHQYWCNIFSILLCEGPQTFIFHDFGIFGRVQSPHKPISFIFGDTRTLKRNQEIP